MNCILLVGRKITLKAPTSSTYKRRLLSSYQKGKGLEDASVKLLASINMIIRQHGGPGDRGVDGYGTWHLIPGYLDQSHNQFKDSDSLNVVVQCKNTLSKVGPGVIREMMGTVRAQPSLTLGVLISCSGFSKQARIQTSSSKEPLLLLECGQKRNHVLSITSFFLNQALRNVLPQLTLAIAYGEDASPNPRLYYKNKLLGI